MEIFLLIGGVAAAFFLSAAILKKNDIIENIVLAVVGYFCIYIITSGLLFWADCFGILLAEALSFGMEAVFLLLVRKQIKTAGLKMNLRRMALPLTVGILLLPVVWDKFEIYGMGQDEGVYQTQAIALMSGDTGIQNEIAAYNEIPEEEREKYLEIVQRKLVGFYLYDESLPMMDVEDKLGDAAGFYHGVPTFPALLALWGRIAGMENMAGIQTLLYFCAIFLIYYILENLKVGKACQAIGTITFAISPIVVWVCKSTLTEMMLVCLVGMFLYLLTGENRRSFILLSALPMVAFSFFHITIYTIIPAIVLLYFLLYVQVGKKEYLIANVIVLAGFAGGIFMMTQVAATYSFVYNFLPLYQIAGFINQENVLAIFMFCTVAAIVMSGVLYLCMRGRVPVIPDEKTEEKSKTYRYVLAAWRVIVFVAIGLNVFVIVKHAAWNGIFDTLRFSTLIGYGLFTGVVLLVCAVVGMIIYADVLLKDKNAMLTGFLFLYLVLIYSALLRSQINYYYYYGRYLVPYLPVVILFGILMIKQIKKKAVRVGCLSGAIIIAFTVAGRYNIVLAEEKDDTRITWQILEECSDIIDNNDTVIMKQDMATVLYLPLMHLTEAEIYMQYDASLDQQLADIQLSNIQKVGEVGDIYFITDEFYGMSQWESVYIDSYIRSEDDNKTERWIPFPTEMKKEQRKIYVYRYRPEQYEYRMGDEEILVNGFYGKEGEARWTNGNGNVYCYLRPSDYEVHLQQGSYLPIEVLENTERTIRLYLNGKIADEYVLTAENRQENMVFHIPAEYVQQGRNELRIESEPWCPADLGKRDARQLGISIQSINFHESIE